MLVCFYVSILCCFGYYQKIISLSELLSGKFTPLRSCNLVLIVLTLYMSSVQTFLNTQKLLSGHSKNTL